MLKSIWQRWAAGSGATPPVDYPQGHIVDNPWMRSGVYTIRALGPFDRFELKARLASMLGAELLGVAHDLMVMAVTVEGPSQANFRRIYEAMRKYAGRGEPLDRKVVAEAAGELWAEMLRRAAEMMPNERELDMQDFLTKSRPYFAAIGPIMSAMNASDLRDLAKHLLLVRPNNAAGLYVRDQPCRDTATIDAVVPHDDLPAILFWALLFNLRPFSHAGESTASSPGQQAQARPSGAPTPSRHGRVTASSTSTAGRPNKSTR